MIPSYAEVADRLQHAAEMDIAQWRATALCFAAEIIRQWRK